MLNQTSSSLSHFILAAYLDVEHLKYLFFAVTAVLFLLIVVCNVFLIVVISVTRSLHEPMYLFLCSLFVNELYGSSGLFPFLLLQILNDTHTVPAASCFLQIFCIYTYGNVEFCNLTVMSYDRYLAICCPLRYHTYMTLKRTLIWIVWLWVFCLVKFSITFSLNLRLTLCGNIINSLFCRNYLLVKLACSDASINNIYGLFSTAITIFFQLFLIMFSYTKILQVCFRGSRETRQKALSTCTPHLVSLLNFSLIVAFEILQTRFEWVGVSTALHILTPLYFMIVQPLLNPIIYGMRMSKIRHTCKMLFQSVHQRLR